MLSIDRLSQTGRCLIASQCFFRKGNKSSRRMQTAPLNYTRLLIICKLDPIVENFINIFLKPELSPQTR